jgi:hypothetical protein
VSLRDLYLYFLSSSGWITINSLANYAEFKDQYSLKSKAAQFTKAVKEAEDEEFFKSNFEKFQKAAIQQAEKKKRARYVNSCSSSTHFVARVILLAQRLKKKKRRDVFLKEVRTRQLLNKSLSVK